MFMVKGLSIIRSLSNKNNSWTMDFRVFNAKVIQTIKHTTIYHILWSPSYLKGHYPSNLSFDLGTYISKTTNLRICSFFHKNLTYKLPSWWNDRWNLRSDLLFSAKYWDILYLKEGENNRSLTLKILYLMVNQISRISKWFTV